jgi:hypothetical protein
MIRTALRVVAVALLIVVAGCGGAGTGGDATPGASAGATPTEPATGTATPAPPPTPTRTAAPAPDSVSPPAGWSEAGVNDTQTALESHYRAVLSGPSTTVTYRSSALAADDNGSINTTLDMRVDTGERRLFAAIDGRESHREAFFADRTLTQWSVRNETVVGRSNTSFIRVTQSVDNGVLRSQLLLYRLEFNGTVTRDGAAVLVYDVVGAYENAVSGQYGAADSASGRIVVTETGRVLQIETAVTYDEAEVQYTYTQLRIGETTVDAPSWTQRS